MSMTPDDMKNFVEEASAVARSALLRDKSAGEQRSEKNGEENTLA